MQKIKIGGATLILVGLMVASAAAVPSMNSLTESPAPDASGGGLFPPECGERQSTEARCDAVSAFPVDKRAL